MRVLASKFKARIYKKLGCKFKRKILGALRRANPNALLRLRLKFSKAKTRAKFTDSVKNARETSRFTKTAESKFSLATSSDKASLIFRKIPSPSAFRAARC